MAASPTFATTPRLAVVQVTTANTARDGSGSPTDVITGVAAGTIIEKIRIQSTVTVTAGVVRIFVYDGSNYRLLKEVMVTATTPSTSVEAWSWTLLFQGADKIVLPSASWKIAATTHNTETFNVFAFGEDLT